ncbi:hypothetical protein [Ralstonia phage BHDT_So9]|uniref:Uncharacterized protein n=1 Tax=Ralstonia phage BHDT_So9 TaxID=2972464 RepID=A0A9E7U8Q3_9CAUD|nr:hypothetical protein [Ralstonia phage BHDT_So9]UWI83527.1 hypothetical protein [Ralstonia phage DLDT_So2]UZT26915.1 hypothetical protein [Ralstonia phage BHDTSo81]WEM03443.1 hypothetical protein [Ralstonia phage BHDT8]
MTHKIEWEYRGVFSMVTASADGETVSQAIVGDFNLEANAAAVLAAEKTVTDLLSTILSTKETHDRP